MIGVRSSCEITLMNASWSCCASRSAGVEPGPLERLAALVGHRREQLPGPGVERPGHRPADDEHAAPPLDVAGAATRRGCACRSSPAGRTGRGTRAATLPAWRSRPAGPFARRGRRVRRRQREAGPRAGRAPPGSRGRGRGRTSGSGGRRSRPARTPPAARTPRARRAAHRPRRRSAPRRAARRGG